MSSVIFDCRTDQGTKSSGNPAEIFANWQGENERWLFMSPHDDDIVCGCGLTFISAIQIGVKTFAGVVTNGKMGYCHEEQKETISQIRQEECIESFKAMGLPKENLYFLGFDDGDLNRQAGRRFASSTAVGPILAGAVGLQNSIVWLLRIIRPTRVFVPSLTDLHPDHKFTNSETVMSIYHAQGNIWPELGEPIPEIPALYEYATYSNFITPPTHRIRVSEDLFERKINSILAYRSQEQIELTVQIQRNTGCKEFIREMRFDLFDPDESNKLF
ncbi:MAG: PIG-L family deacetylase [Planctomycetia bacterium]|nr:PIG-L family deacetylase [Planctomycetia bacterium]